MASALASVRARRRIRSTTSPSMSTRYIEGQRSGHAVLPGAIELVRRLSSAVPVALVTNGPPDIQRLKIEQAGIGSYLSAVVISGEIGIGKPDPAVFDLALDLIDVAPEHAVMVGDSWERDMSGALASGMRAVWISHGRRPRRQQPACRWPTAPPTWHCPDRAGTALADTALRSVTLGDSGLSATSSGPPASVTRMGLGLAALGRPAYINLGRDADLGADRDRSTMEQRCHEMLDAAYAAGIRYVDAARSYGWAEEFLASWFRTRHIAPGALTVGSKWGYRYTGDWAMDAPVQETKDHSLAMFHEQLPQTTALLGRYLDLYQIHSATLESGVLEDRAVLSALAELRDSGVAVGLTVSGPHQADVVRHALDVEHRRHQPLLDGASHMERAGTVRRAGTGRGARPGLGRTGERGTRQRARSPTAGRDGSTAGRRGAAWHPARGASVDQVAWRGAEPALGRRRPVRRRDPRAARLEPRRIRRRTHRGRPGRWAMAEPPRTRRSALWPRRSALPWR